MKLEGTVLGNRYEIIEKIGTGGMATVYKAKCKILNRFVAVKVLREEFTTDEEFIRRFNSEAQSAASLTHPNIVSIYDVGQEYNIYYIVMELVQGKTLKQIISKEGKLPWKWSVNIAIQIASALEAAHKNNIVHRDIKPHNIIITEDGIAKVADFGIAKAVSNSTITAFGTTIGSVHYFSPEHARGGYTDAKSDLYSLGVVMYEMLTGKVPFDADTPVSIALKHMQEEPVAPMKLNQSIPFAINQIILKAMKKDINERYQSATEMLKDLSMALKNPNGDFVETDDGMEESFTKQIPIINDSQIKYTNNRRKQPTTKMGKLKQYFEDNPKVKVISIVALFVLIPLIALFLTMTIINANSVKSVQIPNIVGLTQDEAKEELKKLKINYEVESEEYNNEVEVGKIISQDPKYIENYTVLQKSTIKVKISKGPELVKMPKVAGLTYEEAEQTLKNLNLTVEKIEETSQKIEEGIVISQENAEGEDLKAGDTVKIHVSSGTGIPKVVVVGVVGKQLADAKSILTGLKLEVNVEEQEDTTKSEGVILKQSIEPGTTVEEGTAITITVNKISAAKQGTVNINVKSLTGYTSGTPDKAEIMVKVTSQGTEDTVYRQSISEDTENLSVNVEGKGTITVKVYVDEVRRYLGTINLDSSNTVISVY